MRIKPKPRAFTASCLLLSHAPEAFSTEEPALFEAHMLEAHGAKPGMCAKRAPMKHGVWGPIVGFTSLRLAKQLRLGKGMWSAPRLAEAGRPFEPTDLEPGATVTWRELVGSGEFYRDNDRGGERFERREWIERSGQVWCAGWRPKSAWVIPFAAFEGESAVMVEQRSNGELDHYATQQSSRAA